MLQIPKFLAALWCQWPDPLVTAADIVWDFGLFICTFVPTLTQGHKLRVLTNRIKVAEMGFLPLPEAGWGAQSLGSGDQSRASKGVEAVQAFNPGCLLLAEMFWGCLTKKRPGKTTASPWKRWRQWWEGLRLLPLVFSCFISCFYFEVNLSMSVSLCFVIGWPSVQLPIQVVVLWLYYQSSNLYYSSCFRPRCCFCHVVLVSGLFFYCILFPCVPNLFPCAHDFFFLNLQPGIKIFNI